MPLPESRKTPKQFTQALSGETVDIDDHDLAEGDFETDVLDVNGAGVVNVAVNSVDQESIEVKFDWYDTDGETVLRTWDDTLFPSLSGGRCDSSYPLPGDFVKVRVVDLSNADENVITGKVSFNSGSQMISRLMTSNNVEIEGFPINSSNVSAGTTGLMTYAARALTSFDQDTWSVVKPNQPNLSHGQETVATSGTAVPLNGGTSLEPPRGYAVKVTAHPNNAGTVYVGEDNVTTSNGDPLAPGASDHFHIIDVATIHVDADQDGDSVGWIVEDDS